TGVEGVFERTHFRLRNQRLRCTYGHVLRVFPSEPFVGLLLAPIRGQAHGARRGDEKMAVLFPDHPGFRGAMAPQRVECDLFELEYEGTLPPALEGSFYRCGPDPQFPPKSTDDYFINGDGVVSMFRFRGGH